MASECFYIRCIYHSKDGPLCYEPKCKATPEQLKEHERSRHEYLTERNWTDIPNQK